MSKIVFIVLFLFLGLQLPHSTKAQQIGYRKVFKAGMYGGYLTSAAPVGDGLLTAAYALDSTDSLHTGVKLLRIDSKGVVQASQFYTLDSNYWVYIYEKCLTRINANRYAFVANVDRMPGGFARRYLLVICDSNGQQIRSILTKSDICAADSFTAPTRITYDPKGYLMLTGNVECSRVRMWLAKYDTSLNRVWEHDYATTPLPWLTVCKGVLPDSLGYTLFGGTRLGSSSSPTYPSRSVMIRVDTGGVQQWAYESPSYQKYGEIDDAVQTADGGYVYLTNGPAINLLDPQLPVAAWAGKGAVVKLDANRQVQWMTQYGQSYTQALDHFAIKLFLQQDGKYIIAGHWADTINNQRISHLNFIKYDTSGNMVWWHKHPAHLPDSNIISSYGFYDGVQLTDKSLMMVGLRGTLNTSSTESLFCFVMRTDSNGCVNPNGPECWPLAVPEPPHPSAVTYTLYPNPATDIAVLSRLVQEQIAEIRFTDVSGRAVAAYKMPAGVNSIEIDVSQWSRGVYLYHIYTSGKLVYSGRLVK